MTEEEQTILLIKGTISELPAVQAEVCKEVAEHIRRVVAQAGDVGLLALALVGAEAQSK